MDDNRKFNTKDGFNGTFGALIVEETPSMRWQWSIAMSCSNGNLILLEKETDTEYCFTPIGNGAYKRVN